MLNKIRYSFLKNRLRRPIYLIFFVTSRCNASCRHCFYHDELNSGIRDLDLTEIDAFSRQLGKLVWLSYSGGEPFLREDLYATYRVFAANNAVEHIAIPTNGILTDTIHDVCLKMLQDNRFRSLTVNLSLNGTREIHDRTRGAGSYEAVMRTYEALVPLKKRFEKFSIMAGTILTRQNCDAIEELNAAVRSRMPEVTYHNFEIARGIPPDSRFTAPDPDQLRQIRQELFTVWDHYRYYPSSLQARIADRAKRILYDACISTLETGKQPWPCLAGKVHAVVDYKGEVSLCEALPSVGNLREATFMDIWCSSKADDQRTAIEQGRCACCHSCFQITNLLFAHRHWPRLLM